MKKIAMLALTIACVASSASAQATKTETKAKPAAQSAPKADAKPVWSEHLAAHFAGVDLTPDQKDKIAAANKKHHDAIDKIKATEKNDSISKAQIKGHQDAEHAEFHEILTAEQYAAFETNEAKMEETMKAASKSKKSGAMDHDKMDKAAAKPVKRP